MVEWSSTQDKQINRPNCETQNVSNQQNDVEAPEKAQESAVSGSSRHTAIAPPKQPIEWIYIRHAQRKCVEAATVPEICQRDSDYEDCGRNHQVCHTERLYHLTRTR